MITKLIVTFPCGTKKYFAGGISQKGMKIANNRPHLVQVFVNGPPGEHDEFILRQLKYILHPIHRMITINGEFLRDFPNTVK